MGLFDKSDGQERHASNVTTIAAGTKISGQIDIQCALHIDGQVEGNINSTKMVQIGQSGVVKSNIKAEKLVISGEFIGTAECDSIALLDKCVVQGKLISDSLSVSPNGSFEGQSMRRSSKTDNIIDVQDGNIALSNQVDTKVGQI